MGPNCGGGFAGATPKNLTDAALEPVAAETAGIAGTQDGAREAAAAVFGAMAEQIAENSEARMREDVAQMLEEADAAALASAEAEAAEAAADEKRGAQGEGPSAQPQDSAQPQNAMQQGMQSGFTDSPAGLSAYAAAQSAMIAPMDSGEGYDTPAEHPRGALSEAAAI